MPIQVNIEGKLLDLPVDPVVQSGTTLVPMRAIFEALGAEIKWDNKAQKVTGTKEGTKVELTIGSKTAKKNGVSSQLLVALKIINGSTKIPLRYVSESLDMHVAWINSERQVYIAKDREIEGTTMESVEALYNKYAPTLFKAVGYANHNPDKPSDMPDDIYQEALLGAKGNLAGVTEDDNTRVELVDAVRLLTMDMGIESLGHRQSFLSPFLYAAGFGYNSGSDVVANGSGSKQTSNPNYDYIAWPSKGYFPISWTDKGVNFSVTLNPDKYQEPVWSEVTGRLLT